MGFCHHQNPFTTTPLSSAQIRVLKMVSMLRPLRLIGKTSSVRLIIEAPVQRSPGSQGGLFLLQKKRLDVKRLEKNGLDSWNLR